jgi:hypothetical protein
LRFTSCRPWTSAPTVAGDMCAEDSRAGLDPRPSMLRLRAIYAASCRAVAHSSLARVSKIRSVWHLRGGMGPLPCLLVLAGRPVLGVGCHQSGHPADVYCTFLRSAPQSRPCRVGRPCRSSGHCVAPAASRPSPSALLSRDPPPTVTALRLQDAARPTGGGRTPAPPAPSRLRSTCEI